MARASVKKKSPQSQTKEQKERLLVELAKVPIVQVACQRVGIGRATYYSWREADMAFRKLADKAVTEGSLVINDLAESKLISNIQDGNNTSIIFWLKNHHGGYNEKILHQHEHLHAMEITTDEQREIVRALNNIGYANSLNLTNEEAIQLIAAHKVSNPDKAEEVRQQKLNEMGLGEIPDKKVPTEGKVHRDGINLNEFFKKKLSDGN